MNVSFSSYLSKQKEVLKQIVNGLSGDFPYISLLGTDVSGTRYQVQKTETSVHDSNWCERGFRKQA